MYIIIGPERRIVTESILLHVDCEMVTKISSPIFFINFDILLIYAIIAIKHDFSIH